ncbi:hypothetical protein [Maribacter sp. 2307UL18-2]|uniref:hypothetical protein n=1 Tax=Maribacter sp. 2307UL18-2 TaxID=3386274 RepID=UPI0039BC6FB5
MKVLIKGKYYREKKWELGNKGVIHSVYNCLTPNIDWYDHENPYFMSIIQGNVYDINIQKKPPWFLL